MPVYLPASPLCGKTATLFAIALAASLHVFDLTETTSLRVQAELGVAIAGVSQTVPFATGYDVVLFAGGGYASSFTADADGRRVVGLSGGLLAMQAGLRF